MSEATKQRPKEPMKLWLDADDADWLRDHAERNGRTLTGQLRVLIRRYRVDTEQQKDAA